MKLRCLGLLLGLSLGLLGTIANAATVEVSAGSIGSVSLSSDQDFIGLSLGAGLLLTPVIEPVASLTHQRIMAGGHTSWSLLFLAGSTFNFPMERSPREQFFLSLAAGPYVTGGSFRETETGAAYQGSLGKRFPLGENIAYTPAIGFSSIGGSPLRFTATPIVFSLFL